jgi:hypothetical protein
MTKILTRALEGVCAGLKKEKGVTDEQVGMALMAASLNFLGQAWSGEYLVAHLAGLTTALADHHGIDPEIGQARSHRSMN